MASKSKAGLSPLERKDFLLEHGFRPVQGRGHGSHSIWEHAELKALAQEQKITCPPNFLHNAGQLPWEHTIPDNPASGTWHRVVKHAQWCQETVATAKGASAEEERRRKIKQDFLDARKEICDWKRETKHRLKANLEANPAPASYHRMNELKPA
jgi:hypothetical protein